MSTSQQPKRMFWNPIFDSKSIPRWICLRKLKDWKEKNAIILAHYYQEPDAWRFGYVAIVLDLPTSCKTTADIIVFAGVRTHKPKLTKILNLWNYCSRSQGWLLLADSAPADLFPSLQENIPITWFMSTVLQTLRLWAISSAHPGGAEKDAAESVPADQ